MARPKTTAQMTKARRIDERHSQLGKTLYRWSDAAEMWMPLNKWQVKDWDWQKGLEALRMACRALPWHEFVLTYIEHMVSVRGADETRGKSVADLGGGRWSIGMADALARGHHCLVGDADAIYGECQRDYGIKRMADEADQFRYETLSA